MVNQSITDEIKENIAQIREDGSVSLNLEYFGFLDRLEMTSPVSRGFSAVPAVCPNHT